jgi:tetratricopeptide (TPR) repeat protein
MPGKSRRSGHDVGWTSDGHTFISDRAGSERARPNPDKDTPPAALEAFTGSSASPALADLQEAQTLIERQEYKKALAACERAILRDPTFAPAYMNKAALISVLKRPKDALAVYERLNQIAPGHARGFTRKAELLRELKRDQEALAAYEHAIHLDPDDAEAYTGMGLVLDRLGRGEAARRAYQCARDIGAQQLEEQR